MDEVSDQMNVNINMEYADPGEHQPEAKRNNWLVGERIRTAYHRLPYKAMPKLILRYLAMLSAEQLNYFPVKGGVSAHYSPHQIIKKRNISFKQECRLPLGTYVQAYEDHQIKNDNKARTIDAIYLKGLLKGRHELMSLETGELITRSRIWEVPITSMVIKAVEEMAYKQGIKSLKITSRNKVPLLPADWVAGVDHDKDIEDEDDEDYMPPLVETVQDDDDDSMGHIDQEELDNLTRQDKPEEANPTNRQQEQEEQEEEEDQDGEPLKAAQEQPAPEPQPARIELETVTDNEETVTNEGREKRPPERLMYSRDHMGTNNM